MGALIRLLSHVYAAPLKAGGWDDLLTRFATELRATAVIACDAAGRFCRVAASAAPDGSGRLDDHLLRQALDLADAEVGHVIDLLLPGGAGGRECVAVPVGLSGRAALVLVRDFGCGPFGTLERSMLTGVAPHLAKALQLGARLRCAETIERAAAGAVDLAGADLMLVDARARLHQSSHQASAFLREGWFRLSDGRLHASTLRGTQALHTAIATVASERRVRLIELPLQGPRPLKLRIGPAGTAPRQIQPLLALSAESPPHARIGCC